MTAPRRSALQGASLAALVCALLSGCAPMTVDYTDPPSGDLGSDSVPDGDSAPPGDTGDTGPEPGPEDGDQDGYPADEDCDDGDGAIHPGASEAQDLVDQDCDGLIDEDFVAAGDVIFNELMPAPAEGGEWLELANLSDATLNLIGWSLTSDDKEHTIERDLILAPGGLAVLGPAAGTDYDMAAGALPLGDSEGALGLSAGGRAIDALSYGEGWPAQAAAALSLDPARQRGEERGDPNSWCAATAIPGGEAGGSPGEENGLCGHLDHDGDTFSADQGDCDDTLGSVYPGAEELWDWLDNDCDGVGDRLTTAAAAAWLDGDTNDYLGFRNGLTAGDLNGDGALELGVGSIYLNEYAAGGLYLLDSGDWSAWSGPIGDYAEALIYGERAYGYFSSTSQRQGDQDGDGVDDLLLVGTDYFSDLFGEGAGALFFGRDVGLNTSGRGEGDVLFWHTRSNNGASQALGSADLTGDGSDDVVIAEWADLYDQRGYLYLFDGAALSRGEVDLQDSDGCYIYGEQAGDQLGWSVGAGDTDGDGRDELFVGAPGVDTSGRDVGCVYRLDGRSELSGNASVSWASSLTICGTRPDAHLGRGGPAQLADFDGDGALDLVLSAAAENQVYVFFDAGALEGSLDTDAADVTLTLESPANLGGAMAVGDFNGDGAPDLAVGAADGLGLGEPVVEPGAVLIFSGHTLASGAALLSGDDADLTLSSLSPDLFGLGLLALDLSGDGRDDLAVAASIYGDNAGRVWLFIMP
jgi:hypothetical protein